MRTRFRFGQAGRRSLPPGWLCSSQKWGTSSQILARRHNIQKARYTPHANYILLTVHHSETTLPRATRRTLAQLGTNKCPLLRSYLNKIDEVKHPSPLFPLCKTEPHTTHLFNCTNINTLLQVTDLWTAPVEVVHRLVEWREATSQLAGPEAG